MGKCSTKYQRYIPGSQTRPFLPSLRSPPYSKFAIRRYIRPEVNRSFGTIKESKTTNGSLFLFLFVEPSKIFPNFCIGKDSTKFLQETTVILKENCISGTSRKGKFRKPTETGRERKQQERWNGEKMKAGGGFFSSIGQNSQMRAEERHFNNILNVRPV